MWGDRSGSEPASARSPLRLRRAISLLGAAWCAAAAVALLIIGWVDAWTWVFVALAVAGLADAAVLTRRIRQEQRRPD